MSGRKDTLRAKLKAASQKQLLKDKEHFKNLLRKAPEITHKPIWKITNGQLNIKLREFTEELDALLKKIRKTEKLQATT